MTSNELVCALNCGLFFLHRAYLVDAADLIVTQLRQGTGLC